MEQSLEQRIDELVWMAWSNGQRSAHPMTPPRKADELHAEVWNELQELLREMDRRPHWNV